MADLSKELSKDFAYCEDAVSRKAAIDILDAYQVMVENGEENPYSWARLRMSELPSAQPERLTDYSFEESCTDCPAYDTENHRCPRFNQVIRMALKDANLEPCEDCISRQAAINEVVAWLKDRMSDKKNGKPLTERLKDLPSAQPDNQTNLCDSCDYSYPDCPSKNDDVIFGNGIGNDNICACNKYKPSAQPKPQWIPCSERLPEEKDAGILKKLGTNKRSDYVIATVEVKDERMTVTACTYDGAWEWNMKYAFPGYKIIAWMPLPEPYRKNV